MFERQLFGLNLGSSGGKSTLNLPTLSETFELLIIEIWKSQCRNYFCDN